MTSQDPPREYDPSDPPRFDEWVRLRRLESNGTYSPAPSSAAPNEDGNAGSAPLPVQSNESSATRLRGRGSVGSAMLAVVGIGVVVGIACFFGYHSMDSPTNLIPPQAPSARRVGTSRTAGAPVLSGSNPRPASNGQSPDQERASLETEYRSAESDYTEALAAYTEIALPMVERSEAEVKQVGSTSIERGGSDLSTRRLRLEVETRRDRDKLVAAALHKRASDAFDTMKAVRKRLTKESTD